MRLQKELILEERREKNRKHMERFCDYYGKTGLEYETVKRHLDEEKIHACVSKNGNETRLSIDEILEGIHPLNAGLYEGTVNSSKERMKISLHEGLITSYPIGKLHTAIQKIFAKYISDELLDKSLAEYSELLPIGHSIGKVVDQILIPNGDENENVCQFIVPIDCTVDLKSLINDCIDNLYLYGWDYSMHSVRTSNDKERKVLLITFEKRFSNPIDIVGNFLFHVCPFKVVDKIFRQGITPRSQSEKYRYPERVYLFDIKNQENVEDAIDYIERRKVLNGDEKYCMVMVDFEKIKSNPRFRSGEWKFYVDPMFKDKNNPAIFTYEPIPKSFLDKGKIITV